MFCVSTSVSSSKVSTLSWCTTYNLYNLSIYTLLHQTCFQHTTPPAKHASSTLCHCVLGLGSCVGLYHRICSRHRRRILSRHVRHLE
jgi:hypothetical protein